VGKLVDPSVKAQALAMLSMGHTQSEAADSIGMSQQSVSLLAKQKTAKAIIEHIQVRYVLKAAKLAINNQLHKIKRANKILRDPETYPSKDLDQYKTILELADKAEYRVAQMIGITPAHTASYIFNTLIQAGTDSNAKELPYLGEYYRWKQEQDIQDAEIEEES
jgi:predicted transcriptional regulator